MPKTWTDKEKATAERKIDTRRARRDSLRKRFDAAEAKVRDAEARAARLGEAVYQADRDLDYAVSGRSRMDHSCHVCGSGFGPDDKHWTAFSQDGTTEIGYRCEPCQVVARKVSPASVYGERWRNYVREGS